jgi:hypothetical protein
LDQMLRSGSISDPDEGWDFLRRLVGKTSELEVVEEKEREEAALM